MAAMVDEIRMDAREAIGAFTVRLTMYGLRRMRFRLWLASRIIALARVVSGMNIAVEVTDAPPS